MKRIRSFQSQIYFITILHKQLRLEPDNCSGRLMLGSCLALPTLDMISSHELRTRDLTYLACCYFSAFWFSNETEIE
jgi:hypothetical protein